VRKPAPTLSLVFTGDRSKPEGLVALVPAEGLPGEIPPVLLVTGPGTVSSRFEIMTSNADICSPIPYIPSHTPVVHFKPHVLPSLPPEQDFAAAAADDCNNGWSMFRVYGARMMVAAISRARYALNDCWSTSHVLLPSHATSLMMPFGKKTDAP